jgi:ADP-heptose:LPS heptosyltransferase
MRIQPENVHSVLILKPSALGDIVHALPVLPELKKLFPHAQVRWLVFEHFAGVLEGNKYLDGVIVWKRKGSSLSRFAGTLREIRGFRFDLAIDLQGLARTAAISIASGAKVRIGVPGLREFSWLFEKEAGTFSPTQHAVERNIEIIKYLGGAPGTPEFYINVPAESEKFAENFLAESGCAPGARLLGLLCGAGIRQKMWPVERFAALARASAEKLGATAVFFGSAGDIPRISEVISLAGAAPRGRYLNAAGKTTLKQLCALLKRCRVVAGNDTGPLHLAAALGVPPIGFFGPSSPDILSPYHPKGICFYKKQECSPCGISPSCAEVKCMKEIETGEVFSAVEGLWK